MRLLKFVRSLVSPVDAFGPRNLLIEGGAIFMGTLFVSMVSAVFVFRAVMGRDPRREGKDE